MNKKEKLDFEYLVRIIKKQMDFEPDNYKFKPLRRRIKSRMRRLGITEYRDYGDVLLKNGPEVSRLRTALTINLTRFFRDREVFDILEKKILPKHESICAWSAGCATGAEVYSILIICDKMNKKCKILGTDIDNDSINKARLGIFREEDLKEVEPDTINKYFKRENNKFRISDKIKRKAEFKHLDLKDTEFTSRFNLIICRNVLIYLRKKFQEIILRHFYHSLKPGGCLILGKTETLTGSTRKLYKKIDLRNRIYEKR